MILHWPLSFISLSNTDHKWKPCALDKAEVDLGEHHRFSHTGHRASGALQLWCRTEGERWGDLNFGAVQGAREIWDPPPKVCHCRQGLTEQALPSTALIFFLKNNVNDKHFHLKNYRTNPAPCSNAVAKHRLCVQNIRKLWRRNKLALLLEMEKWDLKWTGWHYFWRRSAAIISAPSPNEWHSSCRGLRIPQRGQDGSHSKDGSCQNILKAVFHAFGFVAVLSCGLKAGKILYGFIYNFCMPPRNINVLWMAYSK